MILLFGEVVECSSLNSSITLVADRILFEHGFVELQFFLDPENVLFLFCLRVIVDVIEKYLFKIGI
jgi:hypothetical protein|tara:strand:- start:264 stop:461 length:198 start_codon:yes stop_codon:yes gene_type:complete